MNSKETRVAVNPRQKDTVFCILFKNKKNLLQLYNALNDSDYTDEAQLEIVTLESAIYMSMKNDVAFVLDHRLYLYEHQSTYNPNMPLRDLFYVSNEYQKLIGDKKSLYASKAVRIPAPRFVVFYNGTEKRPEREWLKLSELYEIPEENPMLELQVLMLNINEGNNKKLKEKCRCLAEYMLYVERIRQYAVQYDTLQEAVEHAIDDCIAEGILADFLSIHKAEAMTVSIFEYDEEKELRLYREAEREVGIEQGIAQEKEFLVEKKIKKNKTLEQIAEELEEDVETIRPLYEKMKYLKK